MMRLGHYRPVHVKSKASQLLRTTLIARKKFVDHMLAIEDTIRGLLKVYGLKIGAVHRCTFAARVETLLADAPDLRAAIEPLLEARNMMRKKKALLDRHLRQVARKDEVCKRLMTVSGVGPIVSLSFKASVDDPTRFKNSKAVAAHFGLTPRVYQSGETRPIGPHQQVRGQVDATCALRGCKLPPADLQEVVDAQSLGREACQADRHEEGLRGGRAQARDHHAPDVGRRDGFPVRPAPVAVAA